MKLLVKAIGSAILVFVGFLCLLIIVAVGNYLFGKLAGDVIAIVFVVFGVITTMFYVHYKDKF